MQKQDYTRNELLDVIGSYLRMIERNGEEHPTVVLSDLEASMNGVLKANNYNGFYKESVC